MNRPRNYILKDKVAVSVKLIEWAEWFANCHRDKSIFDKECRVGGTMIGKIHVSTVFLGLDHSWMGGTPPPDF